MTATTIQAGELFTALRLVQSIACDSDGEPDIDPGTGQTDALAALWRLAVGEAGVVRSRAAGALARLGIAPGAALPCSLADEIAGECIALRLDCRRCEMNPANTGG